MNKPKRKIKFSIKNNKLTFVVEGRKDRMCFGHDYGCSKCNGKYCPLYKKGECACDDETEDKIDCILPCEDVKDAAKELGIGELDDVCPRRFMKEAKLKTPVKELHFTATAEEEYHEDD